MRIGREEFEQLAMGHVDMLYRIALRLTRQPATAEDLVQETYLRAFRARDSFDLKEFGIRPWLVRILRNLHVSQMQREARQPTAVDESQLDESSTSRAPWLDARNFELMDERLVAAIKELPEDYQTVILLWAIEEFSYKEIAEAMEVPIGTVMSRLHRARARLADRLQRYARDEGVIRE